MIDFMISAAFIQRNKASLDEKPQGKVKSYFSPPFIYVFSSFLDFNVCIYEKKPVNVIVIDGWVEGWMDLEREMGIGKKY